MRLPPAHSGRESSSSGRASTSRRIGARASVATCSTRSRNAGAAQWRSSSTSTSGRSRASVSSRRRTAHAVSSMGPVDGASPTAAAIRAATASPSASPARTSAAQVATLPPATGASASRSGASAGASNGGVRPMRHVAVGPRRATSSRASRVFPDSGRPEDGHEPHPRVPDDARERRIQLAQLVVAADERRSEPAYDGLGIRDHLADGVGPAARLGDDGVPEEPPGALAEQHVAGRRGRSKAICLLERLSRHQRLPSRGIARDHLAGRDHRPRDEPGGAKRARDVHRAERVVVVRARDAKDDEDAVVGGAARRAALSGGDRLDLASDAAKALAPRLGVAGDVGGDVREEHGDVLACLLENGRPCSRGLGRRPVERRVVTEDRSVERLELLAGIGAELLDEGRPRGRIRLERVPLAAAAVERQEELCAVSLAERLLADELVELRDELRVAAELEVCVDPALDRLVRGARRGAPRTRRPARARDPRAAARATVRAPRGGATPPRAALAPAPRPRARGTARGRARLARRAGGSRVDA